MPPWADRSLLLLAAPLVGVGWLPWWAVLGLTVALALTHRGEGARSVRLPLLLLGASVGLLVLLPGMRGPQGAEAFMQTFVSVMGGTALVYLGVTALEEGRAAWGAGWLGVLLLLGALVPGSSSPVGLAVGLLALPLALLGAAGVEERPPRRLGGGGRALLGTVGAALAVGGTLLALLAFALPGAGRPSLSNPPPGSAQAPVSSSVVPPPAASPSVVGERARSRSSQPLRTIRDPLPGTELVLLSGLLFFLALAFALWRARSRAPGERFRPRWWEVAAVLGLGLAAALFVATGIMARLGDAAGFLPGAADGSTGASPPQTLTGEDDPLRLFWERGLWVLSLLTFVVFTGLAAALFWLGLRLRPPAPEVEAASGGGTENAPADQAAALHRVRLAYRAALASLAAAGLGRGEAETPTEHAGRVTGIRPALAGPLGTLVTVYAPVRYGGRVTEDEADTAERAAREVAHLTAAVRPDTESRESETLS